MYKEFKKINISEYDSYSGEYPIDSTLNSYLSSGWEIITTYTTRAKESRSYTHPSGTYITDYIDGNWIVHYILGRRELPGVLYG